VLGPYHLGKIFEIDLVTYPGTRRHQSKLVERGLAPTQETVALVIAFELPLHIGAKGVDRSKAVDHDRMIDDKIDRRNRIDFRRVAAELTLRFAHGGKIDHGGNAREILHQHAG